MNAAVILFSNNCVRTVVPSQKTIRSTAVRILEHNPRVAAVVRVHVNVAGGVDVTVDGQTTADRAPDVRPQKLAWRQAADGPGVVAG